MFVSLLLALALASVSADTWPWRQPPNLILIVADDLGYNDVSWQGNSDMPTPNLAKLAAEGVILKEQYVQPLCSPTRSALLTGRYPLRTGMQHVVVFPPLPFGLPLEEKTLPQHLKPLGYDTHLLGKWHLGFYNERYRPTNRGFDTFYGGYTSVDHLSHLKFALGTTSDCDPTESAKLECIALLQNSTNEGCGDGVNCDSLLAEIQAKECMKKLDFEISDSDERQEVFGGVDWHREVRGVAENSEGRPGVYSSADIAEEAIDLLEKHNVRDPMFMMLAFQAVHTPLQVDEEHQDEACEKYPLEDRRILCTMMNGLDAAVGRVVDKLKEKKMYDNSVIVFMSDNGGLPFQASNHPFRGQKVSLLQGGVRVPAFVHAPGRIRKGGVREGKIHAVDWFSTFLSLASRREHIAPDEDYDFENVLNLDVSDEVREKMMEELKDSPSSLPHNGRKKIDGKNMWPFITQGRRSPRKELVVNVDPMCIKSGPATLGPHASIILGKWKYYEGDPGSPFQGNCFLGDGNSLPPPPQQQFCPFPLNEEGVALVNLEEDPGETVNVAGENPWVLRLMQYRLEHYKRQTVEPLFTDPDPLSDPALGDGFWNPWVPTPEGTN